ncbi:23S rRNA (adenine(2503)-C(2))-methyltransferase RlmN [Clostridiaceae bacterium UIB06]|uniref:Probable dual-specificity RNA methyltransferase RlmN n=1 Tax=Clostridium thailandense TaxID=2794346 RepID=A0A949WPX8_9CLOT|nr:23S rRNA (adenine(2503)-C(2))-methyltransferase RlmN [Clostridium thailandense]MBV7271940.1 23S rRNA (adenine(2503)-C(2))-methyltransferase RlmN [Clostridium thailandense]MCH5137166.1 23S rRNA (adenine(2503)-C(2))-methyltransferase RlmN [Clostridiaceae bacterium UIB06]
MYNIFNFNLQNLKQWMKENKESEFRAKQVFGWIYKNIWDFEEMNNVPKSTREKLKKSFYIEIPSVARMYKSELDGTTKFLYKYRDGNIIESVVMKYKHGNSICVSTQIGCRMGCKFCASTLGGIVRNLSSGEILAQVLKSQEQIGERISNIVLMGSGEPLDNYENVMEFLDLVKAEYGLNIGQRHITLSTCGIVPKIKELADKGLQITLAISLHAPNDDLRKSMMPIAYKYSIDELMEGCKYYIEKTNRRITFEYALVNGVNDTKECSKQLIQLLKGMLCHVNLIPVNEVKEREFKKSSSDNIKNFHDILVDNGVETTIRREMGADIDAACGQLRRSYLKSKNDLKGV